MNLTAQSVDLSVIASDQVALIQIGGYNVAVPNVHEQRMHRAADARRRLREAGYTLHKKRSGYLIADQRDLDHPRVIAGARFDLRLEDVELLVASLI